MILLVSMVVSLVLAGIRAFGGGGGLFGCLGYQPYFVDIKTLVEGATVRTSRAILWALPLHTLTD